MHTYRNDQRSGGRLGLVGVALIWLFGALFLVALVESYIGDSLLLVVISVPLVLLSMAPVYGLVFRRIYEIRLSDEGACEFRGAFTTKHLRAQQITSVERNSRWGWRLNDDATEHTLLRFQGGSLLVVQPVDGFDDFVTRLRALNPTFELSGAPHESFQAPEAPVEAESPDPLTRFFRSGLFPLIVIVLIVYLASHR